MALPQSLSRLEQSKHHCLMFGPAHCFRLSILWCSFLAIRRLRTLFLHCYALILVADPLNLLYYLEGCMNRGN